MVENEKTDGSSRPFFVLIPINRIMERNRRLKRGDVILTMERMCVKHGVRLVLDDPQIEKDNGCACSDEIRMGRRYTSCHVMLAIFLHELGHVLISRSNSKKYANLSVFCEESMAWTLAMQLQKECLGMSFSKSQGKVMLKCLGAYCDQQCSFTKGY